MATLPGEPLHARYGFHEVERVDIAMPDGLPIDVSLIKPIN